MKYFLPVLFLLLFTFECSAQTNVIKSTTIPRSDRSASSTINHRAMQDTELNKIDNELNMYKANSDTYSIDRSMELEQQKIEIRSKNK